MHAQPPTLSCIPPASKLHETAHLLSGSYVAKEFGTELDTREECTTLASFDLASLTASTISSYRHTEIITLHLSHHLHI